MKDYWPGQFMTGESVDRAKAKMESERILHDYIVTFLPNGNVKYWDKNDENNKLEMTLEEWQKIVKESKSSD